MSSVTEVLMACGNFELNLDLSSPRSIVENIPTWSTICITPGRCDGLSRSEVLAQATYSGILRSRTNDLCTLRGPSIMAWLGNEDGIGSSYGNAGINGTTSAQDMFDDLFIGFGGSVNGLTMGTYSTLPATPVWAAMVANEVPKVFLDRIVTRLGWQYRVRPNGLLDVELEGSLFRSDPSVVVLADHLGEPIADVLYLVVAGKINATASDDDYATDVSVTDGTYSGAASVLGGPPTGFDPAAAFPDAYLHAFVTDIDLGSNANAAAQAANELLGEYGTKNLIEVRIRLDDPRPRIEPGDTIYIYDPLQGLYTTATQLDIMGQPIFPIGVDVAEMTWPVTEGMGVYVILNGTTTVWDLSEYVLWGSGDTSLRVGAKWPTWNQVVNGRS